MADLKDTFDIPKGLTGTENDFRCIFSESFLRNHGFHVKRVAYDSWVPLKETYHQFSVNTDQGEFIIGSNTAVNNEQSLITYLGNGKWKVGPKDAIKDHKHEI